MKMVSEKKNPLETAKSGWGAHQSALITVLIFFGAQFLAGFGISLFPVLRGWDEQLALDWLQENIYAQFAYFVLAAFLTMYFLHRFLKRRETTFKELGLLRPRLKDIGYAGIGYVVYLGMFIMVTLIAQSLFSSIDPEQSQQIGFNSASGFLQLSMVFIALVVLPPIVEEVLMRGFLYEGLKRGYRQLSAALMTSVIFAAAHLQFGSRAPLLWVAAIDTFVLSLVLISLKEKTGSLAAPIILHALKNGIAFSALFIFT